MLSLLSAPNVVAIPSTQCMAIDPALLFFHPVTCTLPPTTAIPKASAFWVPSLSETPSPFFQYSATFQPFTVSNPATYISVLCTTIANASAFLVPSVSACPSPFFQYLAMGIYIEQ